MIAIYFLRMHIVTRTKVCQNTGCRSTHLYVSGCLLLLKDSKRIRISNKINQKNKPKNPTRNNQMHHMIIRWNLLLLNIENKVQAGNHPLRGRQPHPATTIDLTEDMKEIITVIDMTMTTATIDTAGEAIITETHTHAGDYVHLLKYNHKRNCLLLTLLHFNICLG